MRRYWNYLRLYFEAMDCMPKMCGALLWRAIAVDLFDEYEPGKIMTWWSISSCTANKAVAEGFMKQMGGGAASLIKLNVKTACDISELTFYPHESEALLLPGTRLRVLSRKRSGNVAEIEVEEVVDEERKPEEAGQNAPPAPSMTSGPPRKAAAGRGPGQGSGARGSSKRAMGGVEVPAAKRPAVGEGTGASKEAVLSTERVGPWEEEALLRRLPHGVVEHVCNGEEIRELLPHGQVFADEPHKLTIDMDKVYGPQDHLLALHKHGDEEWQILNDPVELSEDGRRATVTLRRFSYLALLNGAAAAAAIGGAMAAGAAADPATIVGDNPAAAAAAAGGVALGMIISQLSTLGLRREPVACPVGSSGFHIFLSYRRIDADKARSVKQALVALGYQVFMDITAEGLGAGDFQNQLERHLKCTPVVVALCTATVNPERTEECEFLRIKNAGDFVRLEIRAALHMDKLLIPLCTSKAPGTPEFDIGKLIGGSNLPADVVDMGKKNMVELSTNYFDASIAKVHGFIDGEARASDLTRLTQFGGDLPPEP
eukprot:COSAG04_NODE_409_length_14823_cov_4.646767_11_plen_543_part_00